MSGNEFYRGWLLNAADLSNMTDSVAVFTPGHSSSHLLLHAQSGTYELSIGDRFWRVYCSLTGVAANVANR